MPDSMIGLTLVQWACITCTLLMDISAVSCLVCGTRQPRNRLKFLRKTPEIPEKNPKKRQKSRKNRPKKRGRPRTKVIYLV